MSEPITVILADDHPMFRAGVEEAFKADPNVRIVGRASDGETALQMIETLKPRIAILDVQMPKRTGFQVAQEVRTRGLETAIVFLTMHDDGEMLQRALDLGARGYVLKESASADIRACIHVVAEGRTYVSPTAARRPTARPDTSGLGSLVTLTPSEREVLRFIARQVETRGIAAALGISPKTVENHRSNICSKLGITGHNALLKFALQHQALLFT